MDLCVEKRLFVKESFQFTSKGPTRGCKGYPAGVFIFRFLFFLSLVFFYFLFFKLFFLF